MCIQHYSHENNYFKQTMESQSLTPNMQKVLEKAKARLGENEATELITEIMTAHALERQKDEVATAPPAISAEQAKYEELMLENQKLKHEKRVAEFKNSLRGPLGDQHATTIAAALPADLSEENTKLITNITDMVIQAGAAKNAAGGFREPAAPFMTQPLGEKRKNDEPVPRAAKSRERALLDDCLGFMRNANNRV